MEIKQLKKQQICVAALLEHAPCPRSITRYRVSLQTNITVRGSLLRIIMFTQVPNINEYARHCSCSLLDIVIKLENAYCKCLYACERASLKGAHVAAPFVKKAGHMERDKESSLCVMFLALWVLQKKPEMYPLCKLP